MRKLVFIHGRSQQNKDSVQLKADWIEAWRTGLKKSGLDVPIDDDAIHFPYYGDRLAQIVDGVRPEDAARIMVRGAQENADAADFMNAVVQSIVQALGISQGEIEAQLEPADRAVVQRNIENWPWVQAILRAADEHVPGAGQLIALVTYDVYLYLTNGRLRPDIRDGVGQAIFRGTQNVIVSHSLGTIVAYDMLRQPAFGSLEVPLLVTLGSPLGIGSIRDRLGGVGMPRPVRQWFNARDPRDVVALYGLDRTRFPVSPPIINKDDVDNWTDNRHGIAGYLSDEVVARNIYDSICGKDADPAT